MGKHKAPRHIALHHLINVIETGDLPPVESHRFADVSILPEQPEPQPIGFYPEDDYLVTPHVDAVARFFICMREAFRVHRGYGVFREPLFSQLAEAANWYTAHNPDASAQELLRAILVEAYAFRDGLQFDPDALLSPSALIRAGDRTRNHIDPFSLARPSTPDEVLAELAVRTT